MDIVEPYCPRRMLYRKHVLLDANCINARGKNPDLNQIDVWKENRVILVAMSNASYHEALAGGAPNRGRKVMGHIFTLPIEETDRDRSFRERIEAILFPGGCKDQNQQNDVESVLYAQKNHRVLVTMDGGSKSQPGGILGNREQLSREVEVVVMRPHEAVATIREEIQRRDELARAYADRTGKPLPDWVGQD